MKYAEPQSPDSLVQFQTKYGNYIGGEWVGPVDGAFFDVICPINGKAYTQVPRSNEKDVELALNAAHRAFPAWSRLSAQDRSLRLFRVADAIEKNLEKLAVAESWGNGKPVRETLAADLPLVVDHFRYFASVLRSEESGLSELDAQTVSYHFREPLGVVAQIIPWNFPLLMAAWKMAPALAGGNCVVLKPAEQTPVSILLLAECIQSILPPGVFNIVNGFGIEAGKPLASSPRVAKIAFTGETGTGRLIMKYAAENIIPVTLELGGKSPNIFMADIFDSPDGGGRPGHVQVGFPGQANSPVDGIDDFVEKALEGFTLFALNQGEVCTCPSRALIQESIYDRFMEKALDRVRKIKVGHPLDTETMMGAQVSADQIEKILQYIQIGKNEGARILTGGQPAKLAGLESGYFMQPTVLEGQNQMRVFQEEIFGPVVSVTRFKDAADAIRIANDTLYGLGAGLWTRNVHNAYTMARQIQAGRVWTNCYHLYPAHAAFGGYKQSGMGRETHKMMLAHYTQTKNVLVSYDPKPMGLF